MLYVHYSIPKSHVIITDNVLAFDQLNGQSGQHLGEQEIHTKAKNQTINP